MNRGRSNFGVFLLLFEIFNIGYDRIPKVTLMTVVGQILVYLRVTPLPGLNQVCASVLQVWYREDYRRIFLATYFHADDWHLYYNMVSFLWKGRSLEPLFGSTYMAAVIVIFGILTNIVMLLLNMAAEAFLHKPAYLTDCAVGFSGVLFALKVVTTQQSPPQAQGFVLGLIPFPLKYMVWAELFVIQLISPNVSFTGHLAGILVGLAYTLGPLKSLLETLFRPNAYNPRRRTWGGGRVGGSRDSHRPDESRYAEYSAGLSEEEQMRAAMDASLHQNAARGQTGDPYSISSEEIRRRRLARFDNR